MKREIDYIQIYGERNSGTNYVEQILQHNLEGGIQVGFKYGWKHGFIDLDNILKFDTRSTLFLFVTKDPYSWLVSMNNKPHHAPHLYNLNFSEFIRSEWCSYNGMGYEQRALDLINNPLRKDEEMMHERHPETGERIRNLPELRNLKNASFLSLKKEVHNFYHIRYEDILENPSDLLERLSQNYTLRFRSDVYIPTGHYGLNPNQVFTKQLYYKRREYFEVVSIEDLYFINNEIDWSLERRLNYTKVISFLKSSL